MLLTLFLLGLVSSWMSSIKARVIRRPPAFSGPVSTVFSCSRINQNGPIFTRSPCVQSSCSRLSNKLSSGPDSSIQSRGSNYRILWRQQCPVPVRSDPLPAPTVSTELRSPVPNLGRHNTVLKSETYNHLYCKL
jgi:hypothetical protein